MFIKTHNFTSDENSPILAFLPSSSVQVFPCGRRRANPSKNTYVPFDPEARLNTEANNRKRTGINGFSTSYINNLELNTTASRANLSFVIAGYFFQIETALTAELNNIESLIQKYIEDISKILDMTAADKIYANIKIEKAALFEGEATEYKTAVLGPQLDTTGVAVTCLDILAEGQGIENSSNYYFSGLSFSTESITEYVKNKFEIVQYGFTLGTPSVIDTNGNQYVSLCILKKVNGVWQLNQSALLPNIQHGDTEGSAKVAVLEAEEVVRDGITVAAIELGINNTLKIFTKKKPVQTN